MRVSRLMLVTLRDTPADAEIASHQLLIRGGFIKRVTSGIYAYMPLMLRVLKKITCIIQEELNAKGCLETLLPQLHPSEIWQQTGRWNGYTAGEGIMFHLTDRQGKELGLGPTHEEVITKLAAETIRSYKQLPINIYQIQTKFRDEIRPRFGLMRSREFIMKDAYSFHSNEKDLKKTYLEMNDAYQNIFKRCGIETVSVDADSGAIGGAESREFMVTAEAGEDLILISPDKKYAANQEKAVSKAREASFLPKKPVEIRETIDQKSIELLCEKQGFDPSQIIKVILILAMTESNELQPVLISIRGDQELNEVKVINEISKHLKQSILSLKLIDKGDLESYSLNEIPIGFIGPDLSNSFLVKAKNIRKKFIRFADHTAANLESFVCGANKLNQHKVFANWSLFDEKPEVVDIRTAQAGERSTHDINQMLIEKRGIEIGHIFQLGCKYSKSLGATFTNDLGIEEPLWMGCYGIGVSRLAQAAVEQSHDNSGIIWPLAIAPFEIVVIIANIKDEIQKKLGETIYQELVESGIDALIDDRDERAGVKFKDADLIGIPWKIIAGRDSKANKVELRERGSGNTKLLDTKQAIDDVITEISRSK